jgi:hypothetical protein
MGMLTYLSTTTHPDIAFAVHQYACFSINHVNPHRVYEISIHQIICYLKGASDKGYILRPIPSIFESMLMLILPVLVLYQLLPTLFLLSPELVMSSPLPVVLSYGHLT